MTTWKNPQTFVCGFFLWIVFTDILFICDSYRDSSPGAQNGEWEAGRETRNAVSFQRKGAMALRHAALMTLREIPQR